MITLSRGDWAAEIRPRSGGALTRLTWRGEDVLRPTPPGVDDPLQTACFPLVPWANRIAAARFAWEGLTVELEPTPGFAPHALHGTGWHRPWGVAAADGASAVLTLEQPRSDWPWAWTAEQRFTLDGAGLSIGLSVTNADQRPMPAGLGLHPYFVRRPGTRVSFEASGVWTVDEALIPVDLAEPDAVFDWCDGPDVEAAPFVDHAYAGWDGVARLTDADRTVTLRGSANASVLHVFAPAGGDFVCLEPVTHPPDALNAPAGEETGLVRLEPGQTSAMSLTITAEART
ncbi:MAG: aldose 1-epimerase [Caulobacteraceae bacterium]|nr:aldose 1-epimerase [Caulobacteraceae bacterium]